MKMPGPDAEQSGVPSALEWLDRPLSAQGCFIGWVCAFVVFIGITSLLGGPTEFDAALSVYSTWAIANGHFACSYVSVSHLHVPPIGDPFTLSRRSIHSSVVPS